jgi:hypothetical protein
MAIEDIETYENDIDRPYKEIGPIKAMVGARTVCQSQRQLKM